MGADQAVEAAGNLKGWQRYFNSVTIKGRRNVSTLSFLFQYLSIVIVLDHYAMSLVDLRGTQVGGLLLQ